MFYILRVIKLSLALVLVSYSLAHGATRIDEGGVSKGYFNAINFESGATVTKDGITADVAVTGAGAPPVTTKGDIYTYSTGTTRLPVGTNGQILNANSTETTGLKWITADLHDAVVITTPDANVTDSQAITFADTGPVAITEDTNTITFTVDNIAVSNLADGTDGNLITWDASAAPTVVATGDAGQVLTSGGVGVEPTFQAVSATNITVADTTDTTCWVGLWESQTGSQAPKSDGGVTYNAGTGILTSTGFAGDLTGDVTGNADTVTNATLTTALTVDTGTVGLTGNVANNSVLTLGAGASSVSGANTGDNTVATSGDAAEDFFGAGVSAVTDATVCTDIEGTNLSITGGTLNVNTDLSTYNNATSAFIVAGDVAGNETDPLSLHLDQTTPQTMVGLSDGFITLSDGVITADTSTYLTALTGAVLTDGSTPLTANWDVGNFTVTANNFTADGTLTDGTATLTGGALTGLTGGIQLDADNAKLYFGAGDDMSLWFDGVNGRIDLGSTNTLVGTNTGASIGSGENNVYIGNGAGYYSTGSSNLYLGDTAGFGVPGSVGGNNTGIGRKSLQVNTSGINNTAIGCQAGISNTTGSANTFVGYDAGRGATTGTGNIAIGNSAGQNQLTTGSYSLFIGNGAVANPLIRGYMHPNVNNSSWIRFGRDNTKVYIGTGNDISFDFDGTDLNINTQNVGTGDLKILGGDVKLTADNQKLYFGAGDDSSITDTGSLMTIDPDANSAGSRYLLIDGQALMADKLLFTQTDGNEYIDSLNDGYIDIGATTGIRLLKDTVVTGDVSATNLSGSNTGDNTVCTSGTATTVSTITGLAPDTQNTYARTQYLIPYASTTTAFGEIAIGTDGQVLTSAGAGVAPSFENTASVDTTTLTMNIALNSFRIAVNGALAVFNMIDGIADEYQDETGIDTATSTNESYDSAGDYYSSTGGGGEDASTYLLLHVDGADEATSTTDATERHGTINFRGTAQLDTAFKKWGTASLLLDGNSDWIDLPDSTDWDLIGSAADSWTIDCWVKMTDHADANEVIVEQYEPGGLTNFWSLRHADSSGLLFRVDSSDTTIITFSGGEITDSNWHHVCLKKVGDKYGLYLDGIQTAYVQDASTDTYAGLLYIGAEGGNTRFYFDGSIDEMRIQHSNIFGGTPNVGLTDTITVPTQAYGNITTNMILISDSFTAETEPSTARLILLEEDVDATTINTDLKGFASRDEGSTWNEITLADKGDYSTGVKVLTGTVTLTSTGTDMTYKVQALNDKEFKLHAASLSWE